LTLRKLFILRSDVQLAELGRFIKANWQAMADAKSPLRVELSEWKSKRSRMQNDRYWALLEQVAEQAMVGGRLHDRDVWHEYYKRKFLGAVDLPFGGTMARSSTSLNVAEFGDYMEQVTADAAQELGVRFTVPNWQE